MNGKRKAFHKGGNSSCRQHIRKHYEVYKALCEKGGIPINHHAIPRDVWKEMEKENKEKKTVRKPKQQQLQLEGVTGPCEFTRAGMLHAVTKLIATNTQVCGEKVIESDEFTYWRTGSCPCR